MKKTGLFFGSFNPIHIGHLIIAEYFVENTDLDEVWFVLSPSNPLKKKSTLLNEHQRYYMVSIAVEDDPRFRVCDIELKLPTPSYTCNTLAHLTEKYPHKEFVLLMGEDNWDTIEKWKNYTYILENHYIYIYPRASYKITLNKQHPHVLFVDAPILEISATMIRESIKNRKKIQYLLPQKVEKYIDEMGVYSGSFFKEKV